MSRSDRMFEIIQILRRAKMPVTAEGLADALEVTKRTIYRDIAALQGQRVPIDGEAGVGYILRPGFDLPPLMFCAEEVEAISVGISMLARSGDAELRAAAHRVTQKINDVLPDQANPIDDTPLLVSGWNAIPTGPVNADFFRRAIRREQVVLMSYRDEQHQCTERLIKPFALIYYIDVLIVAAWCELRQGFRHFRLDRMISCVATDHRFVGEGSTLRSTWEEKEGAKL